VCRAHASSPQGALSGFLFFREARQDMPSRISRPSASTILNILIIVLAIVVGVLGYSFVRRQVLRPPVETAKSDAMPAEVIQIDVLNGCGIPKAASGVTAYLRSRGYDVVEMRNYRTFDVDESLVIDRTGNLETARRVAYALGVREKNIVQQINHDYYVDVSVVIGRDYQRLKAAP
jgi:hypothetical protein